MDAPSSQPSQGSPDNAMARVATTSKSWAVMRAWGSRQQPGSMRVSASNVSVGTPRRDNTSSNNARYSADTEYSVGSIFRIVMTAFRLRYAGPK